MIPLQRPRFQVWMKIISIVVIFAFVTTSLDIRLALAYSVAPTAAPITTDINDKKDLLGDIRYSTDYSTERPELPQHEIAVQEFEEKQIGETMAEKPAIETLADFSQGEALFDTTECVTTGPVETCIAETAECASDPSTCAYYKIDIQNDRILEIGDFSNSDFPDQLEKKEFYYDDTGQIFQIVTRGLGEEPDTYQIYSYEPGTFNPEKVMSSGLIIDVEGEETALEIREYDWDNNELTLYDITTESTQIWEIINENEIGHLLIYQGPYDHDSDPSTEDLDVYVQYQYDGDQITFYDYVENTFMIQNVNGDFIASGVLVDNGSGQLSAKILQEAVGDTYRFYDATDTNYFQVVERLPNGGVGRLLQYLGPEDPSEPISDLIHVEYLYDDENGILTYIDHFDGLFYRAYLLVDETSGLLEAVGDFIERGTFAVSGETVEFKITLRRIGDIYQVLDPDHAEFIAEYEILPTLDFGRLLRYRGPPFEDPESDELIDLSCVYDDVQNQVFILDYINQSIELYELAVDGETFQSLLATGSFNDQEKIYSIPGISPG